MKRVYMFFVWAVLLFALSACGNGGEGAEGSSQGVSGRTQGSPQPVTEETQVEGDDTQSSEETASVSEESGGRTLVAYFTMADIVPEGADAVTHTTPMVGNTEAAALEIGRQTGGELFAIKTVSDYPVSHSECSAIAEEEMKSDARPELSTHVEDMGSYSVIYIGFPIWWYQEPMAVRTFLEEYDFSGKTIIPFCTTLGAGIGESEENIRSLCPDAVVLEGLTLRTGQDSFEEAIADWIAGLGVEE